MTLYNRLFSRQEKRAISTTPISEKKELGEFCGLPDKGDSVVPVSRERQILSDSDKHATSLIKRYRPK